MAQERIDPKQLVEQYVQRFKQAPPMNADWGSYDLMEWALKRDVPVRGWDKHQSNIQEQVKRWLEVGVEKLSQPGPRWD